MANIVEMLDELQTRALHEEDIREKLLATRDDSDPLGAFCRACRELGMRSMRWNGYVREKSSMRL